MECKWRKAKRVRGSEAGGCEGCVFRGVAPCPKDPCNEDIWVYADEQTPPANTGEKETLSKREQIALACLTSFIVSPRPLDCPLTAPEQVKAALRYADEFLKQSAEGAKK